MSRGKLGLVSAVLSPVPAPCTLTFLKLAALGAPHTTGIPYSKFWFHSALSAHCFLPSKYDRANGAFPSRPRTGLAPLGRQILTNPKRPIPHEIVCLCSVSCLPARRANMPISDRGPQR